MRTAIIVVIIAAFGLLSLPLPSAARAGGRYTVQAGSYRQEVHAENDFTRLRGRIDAPLLAGSRIEKIAGYFVLRVGDFATAAAARQLLDQLTPLMAGARIVGTTVKKERLVRWLVPPGAAPSASPAPSSAAALAPATPVKRPVRGTPPPDLAGLRPEEQYYTVQTGSYAHKAMAAEEYEAVGRRLGDDAPWRRIERVQGYFTVRVGAFAHRGAAEKILYRLDKRYPGAKVLLAYVRPERIVRLAAPPPSSATAPEPPQPAKAPPLKPSRSPKTPAVSDRSAPGATGREPQFYTLQLASFVAPELAAKGYEQFLARGGPGGDQIRLERVQGYYTLRLGRFADVKEAKKLLAAWRADYPEAKVLRAYVRPERIVDPAALGHKDAPAAPAMKAAATTPPRVINSRKRKKKIAPSRQPGFAAVHPPAGAEEWYTLQVASFSEPALADLEFSRLRDRFAPHDLPDLRIEFVKGFFTVRIGKFPTRKQAEALKKIVAGTYPRAAILLAYVLPQRIQRQVGTVVSPTPPAPPTPSAAVAGKNAAPEEDEIGAVLDAAAVHPPAEAAADRQQSPPAPAESLADSAAIAPEEKKPSAPETEEGAPEKGLHYEVVTVITRDDRGDAIKMPAALFYDPAGDDLYLINGVNNRIIIYGPDFFPENSIGPGRGVDSPLDGVVTPAGDIIITQAGTPHSAPRITVLNRAFFKIREVPMSAIADSDGFIPQKIARAPSGDLYVTGLNAKRVLHLGSDFTLKGWIEVNVDRRGDYVYADAGGGDGRKALIKEVQTDSQGNVFLLSEETSKVYAFNSRGNFLFAFGSKGGAEGKMSRPRGLVVDEKRRCFFIVDYMRHTVLLFDFTGAFRYEFGGRGWGAEWFNYPVDIALGRDGQIMVADFFNQRCQVFDVSWPEQFPKRPEKLWGADLGVRQGADDKEEQP